MELQSPDGHIIAVSVEIADDDAERARGLMHREHLDDGTGMLFVFDEEQPLGFWMKNTLIPLDIAYFSAIGEFVSSATMEPCVADPCVTYPSKGAARYAVEVPAGFLKKNGIGPNWILSFSR